MLSVKVCSCVDNPMNRMHPQTHRRPPPQEQNQDITTESLYSPIRTTFRGTGVHPDPEPRVPVVRGRRGRLTSSAAGHRAHDAPKKNLISNKIFFFLLQIMSAIRPSGRTYDGPVRRTRLPGHRVTWVECVYVVVTPQVNATVTQERHTQVRAVALCAHYCNQ